MAKCSRDVAFSTDKTISRGGSGSRLGFIRRDETRSAYKGSTVFPYVSKKLRRNATRWGREITHFYDVVLLMSRVADLKLFSSACKKYLFDYFVG